MSPSASDPEGDPEGRRDHDHHAQQRRRWPPSGAVRARCWGPVRGMVGGRAPHGDHPDADQGDHHAGEGEPEGRDQHPRARRACARRRPPAMLSEMRAVMTSRLATQRHRGDHDQREQVEPQQPQRDGGEDDQSRADGGGHRHRGPDAGDVDAAGRGRRRARHEVEARARAPAGRPRPHPGRDRRGWWRSRGGSRARASRPDTSRPHRRSSWAGCPRTPTSRMPTRGRIASAPSWWRKRRTARSATPAAPRRGARPPSRLPQGQTRARREERGCPRPVRSTGSCQWPKTTASTGPRRRSRARVERGAVAQRRAPRRPRPPPPRRRSAPLRSPWVRPMRYPPAATTAVSGSARPPSRSWSPAHRDHRRHRAEVVEHRGDAQIAGVEDQVAAVEGLEGGRRGGRR